jgi:hypothetical protein
MFFHSAWTVDEMSVFYRAWPSRFGDIFTVNGRVDVVVPAFFYSAGPGRFGAYFLTVCGRVDVLYAFLKWIAE